MQMSESDDGANRPAREVEGSSIEIDPDDVVRLVSGHVPEVAIVRADAEMRGGVPVDAEAEAVAEAVVLDRAGAVNLETAPNQAEASGGIRLDAGAALSANRHTHDECGHDGHHVVVAKPIIVAEEVARVREVHLSTEDAVGHATDVGTPRQTTPAVQGVTERTSGVPEEV